MATLEELEKESDDMVSELQDAVGALQGGIIGDGWYFSLTRLSFIAVMLGMNEQSKRFEEIRSHIQLVKLGEPIHDNTN